MPTTIDHHIGDMLRYHRKLRGLTQQELAQRLGVSFQQLQKYESARNRMSPDKIFAAARCLDIAVSALFPEAPSVSPQLPPRTRQLLRYYSQLPTEHERQLLIDLCKVMCHREQVELRVV